MGKPAGEVAGDVFGAIGGALSGFAGAFAPDAPVVVVPAPDVTTPLLIGAGLILLVVLISQEKRP